MRGRAAILDSTDVQERVFEVDLIPMKVDQHVAMPEGHQFRGVTVPPAVALQRFDQPFDLALG